MKTSTSMNIEVNAADLKLRAPGTATLLAIREAAANAGAEVVGLPQETITLQQAVDHGLIPRRCLLGVELERDNQVVKFGGNLKDVVGYDFTSLCLGGGGRFGKIEAATLRLQPPGAGAWAGDVLGKAKTRSDLPDLAAALRNRI